MTKKIVVMVILPFMFISDVVAMLVTSLKKPIKSTFQQQYFYTYKITSQEKMKELQFNRQYLFERAIQMDDVKVADLLMKKFKCKAYDDLIELAKSPEMLQCLEKYGCNICGIHDGHGGNYLYKVIANEGKNNTEITKDFFIQYALDKGVDPHAVNNFGENLWHTLLNRPFRFHRENHVLHRAKLLRSLCVNPHHKNEFGKSAAERVRSQVRSLEGEAARGGSYVVSEVNAYKELLNIMIGNNFDKSRNSRE